MKKDHYCERPWNLAHCSARLVSGIMRIAILLMIAAVAAAQPSDPTVRIVGAMKNVMWGGQLQGTIGLDTISPREHLYGLGPAEFLRGELLIVDGRSYRSTVAADSTMIVEETSNARAPFFVYAKVDRWIERQLPDSIRSLSQFESYLDQITASARRPFAFRLTGTVETAMIHIVNLPQGTAVTSPDRAAMGRRDYHLRDQSSMIIGFFSTEHQGIFTHHDSYVHMHLLTDDHTGMGHVAEALFKRGTMTLSLPAESNTSSGP